MSTYVSRPVPAGHLVVADLDDCTVVARFHDEAEPRDVSAWFADLVLIGLGVRHEIDSGETAEPSETVEVARVSVEGAADAVRVIYVHHPTATAVSMDLADALDAASAGIARQIVAGVAHDLAEDADPGELLGDGT